VRSLAPCLIYAILAACGSSSNPDPSPMSGADAQPPFAADGGVLPDPPQATSAVLTWHNDTLRTGAQLAEDVLSPDAVRSRGMRLAYSRPVDKAVHTQVLYQDGVFYTATMANTVFAFDAEDASASGTEAGLLWKRTLVDPQDATARPYPRGIAATPVIDDAAGMMYVVFSTKNQVEEPWGESEVDAQFWIAALDLATGEVLRTARVEAEVPRGDGTMLPFLARNHRCRPALLLVGGSLWFAFGTRSKEGMIEYHGWVFRYDAATLTRQGVWNATPDFRGLGQGGGIWMGGAGLAADPLGAVYFITGNAAADLAAGSYGNSFVKLAADGDRLDVAAAFTPSDPERNLERFDVDLGSGGVALMPGTRRLVGGGKTGILYLLDLDGLTLVQELQAFTNVYNPTFDNDSDWIGGPHLHGGPVFWQGPDPDVAWIYHWAENDYLKGYRYLRGEDRLDPEPVVGRVLALANLMPGGILSLSAHGTEDGIVWAILPADDEPDPSYGEYPGRLLAFDALTLELLWDGETPTVSKWMPPTIAGGKVFAPTSSKEIEVWTLGD
jgi:hypothetical protein